MIDFGVEYPDVSQSYDVLKTNFIIQIFVIEVYKMRLRHRLSEAGHEVNHQKAKLFQQVQVVFVNFLMDLSLN